jgi:hypothetical protein
MSAARPEVGAWYQTPEGGYLEVVAYDVEEGSIAVQYYDGTIEEYDPEIWDALAFTPAEPPEDWAGSLDVTGDDYGVDLDRPATGYQGNPLDLLEDPELDDD